jgi:4-aminobutyrate aminotransferase
VSGELGSALPRIRVPPPGPRSLALAGRLERVESRNVTHLSDDFPVFWEEARGSNVVDVDGNVYVDLTAGFAVAAAGHAHPRIVAAVREQAGRLLHGMGDVHPPEVKVRLLERLSALHPAGSGRTVLAGGGAEAVEVALKTAVLATGRPGVIAFRGAYHGLTLGALSVCGRDDFREPFLTQLTRHTRFLPFPHRDDPSRPGRPGLEEVTGSVSDLLRSGEIGAVIVEPVQGRGGDVIPPAGFLPALRELCDAHGALLIADEIYTGLGRTGRWLACEHTGTVPDLLLLGKALTGGLPMAACIGTEEVMAAWPPSQGEALHTSTFLGNPTVCAAALASLAVIEEEGLVERSAALGREMLDRLRTELASHPRVAEVRGVGMMVGIELVRDRDAFAPDAELAAEMMKEAMRRGVLLLPGGVQGNVLSLSPPLSIARAQLDHALGVLVESLREPGAG